MRSRGWLSLVLLSPLVACRAPSPLSKQPAFDFAAHPGPAPSAFSPEATLLARWADGGTDSLKDFWSSGEAGTFTGVDGVVIAYRIHRAARPKAGVVLLPGRTEAIIKYAEVAQDLVAQGYSTYALTLRGQGEAGRLLPDRDKGYVLWFDDYVADTHHFIAEKVRPEQPRVFMLAHSLGGAVAALVVDQHPTDLDALALTAPMLDINLGAFPAPVAATLGETVCGGTDGTGWSIGAGPYQEETDFEHNSVTHSEPRFHWKIQHLRDDPTLRLGGVTWRWVCEALQGSSRAQAVGRFASTPVVLFQASLDSIVNPAGQQRYCADAPRCTLVRVEGAKHELLQESDALRAGVMGRVVGFFDAQVAP